MMFDDIEPTAVRRARWNRPTNPVPFTPTVYPAGTRPPPIATHDKPPMWPALVAAVGLLILAAACWVGL